jgi:hypothetical protein
MTKLFKPLQILLPLILLLAIAPTATAQRHYLPHIHVGVHGGITMSKQ